MERVAAVPAPVLLFIPLTTPVNAAAEKLMAFPEASPILLLLILAAEVVVLAFDMAVNPAVVAVEVFPLKILSLIFSVPLEEMFTIPKSSVEEAAAITAMF